MSAPTWKQVAKRWADGVLLDEAHSLLLVRWATTLAESQGTWSSVEDALEAEAGLHEADAQALALEVRRLVHRLAAAGADS